MSKLSSINKLKSKLEEPILDFKLPNNFKLFSNKWLLPLYDKSPKFIEKSDDKFLLIKKELISVSLNKDSLTSKDVILDNLLCNKLNSK